MICTDCALFGYHRGHNIQKFDSNVNVSMLLRKRSEDVKEMLEEIVKETQAILTDKLQQLTEFIDIKFNQFIVNALLERENSFKNALNYISEFSRLVTDDSFTPNFTTQNFEVLKEWKKSIQQGEMEKPEALKFFNKLIESISVSFDDSLSYALKDFCLIDKQRGKLIQPIPVMTTESTIPKYKDVRSRAANLVEEISPLVQENLKYQDYTPPVKERVQRESLLENFVYKYETEDHKFDKLKRTISNKTVYESQNLRDIGIDLRLDKEDLIVLRSWNEDQNISEVMKRIIKENYTSINRHLAQYDVDLQIQEGIFKLVGSTQGSEPITDENLIQIQNTLSPMASLENLGLSLMHCGKLRSQAFEEFCKFLGDFTELKELDLTFWGLVQVGPSSLLSLTETFSALDKLRVLKLSFGEWKGLTDEGIDKLRGIQNLSQLEHLELNLGRTSVTNKGLKVISELVGENTQISFLKLNLSSCLRISDLGFNELNQGLQKLKNLKCLSLNFDNCSDISDNSLVNLCSILLKNAKKIESLCLFFYSCSKITDKTASTLCSFLPKISLLNELALDFRWCNVDQEVYSQKLESLVQSVVNKKILL